MASIFAELPKPDNKVTIDFKNGINADIRTVLERRIKQAPKEAAIIAKYFKGPTEYDTARNIWNYLRKAIKYKIDPKGFQKIRMPRHFHHYKTGDCKSYTLNAIAIWKALYPNLPAAPKYTAYEPNPKVPTHVYAVVKDRYGKPIIIDGCYNFFDKEKYFTLALPIKYDMTIQTLSGPHKNVDFNAMYDNLPVEQQRAVKGAIAKAAKLEALKALYAKGEISLNECLSGLGELEQSIGKAKKTKEQKKEARKKRRKKAGLFFKKLGQGMNFIAMAPIRGAFSSIIAMNVNGLASNMRLVKEAKDQTHWKKIVKFWNNVGGLTKALNKAVQIGTKHKALWMSKKAHARFLERAKKEGKTDVGKGAKEKWLRGIGGFESEAFADYISEWNNENGIGVAPAVAAAALALGASLLAGISPIITKALQKTGHKTEAASMEGSASDLVTDAKAGKLKVNETMIDAGAPIDPNNEPGNPDEQGEAPEPPDGETMEGIGAVKDSYVIMGIGEEFDPISDAADVLTALTPTLTTLFQTGVTEVGKLVKKKAKKNPKLQQVLNKGETFADDYFAGQNAKRAQIPWHNVKYAGPKVSTGFGVSPIVLGLGGAVLLGGMYLISKRR